MVAVVVDIVGCGRGGGGGGGGFVVCRVKRCQNLTRGGCFVERSSALRPCSVYCSQCLSLYFLLSPSLFFFRVPPLSPVYPIRRRKHEKLFQVKDVRMIKNAKVPIMKFVHSGSGVQVQFIATQRS